MEIPDGWNEKDSALYRKFEFEDFIHAFSFITAVALQAQQMNHHPLWKNVYSTVEFWLNTHDAGDKVTDKDVRLAKKINDLYK